MLVLFLAENLISKVYIGVKIYACICCSMKVHFVVIKLDIYHKLLKINKAREIENWVQGMLGGIS